MAYMHTPVTSSFFEALYKPGSSLWQGSVKYHELIITKPSTTNAIATCLAGIEVINVMLIIELKFL